MGTQDRTFLSVPEFATNIGLSTRTIWRLIRDGELPSLQIGRRRLIQLDAGVEAIARIAQANSGKKERQ